MREHGRDPDPSNSPALPATRASRRRLHRPCKARISGLGPAWWRHRRGGQRLRRPIRAERDPSRLPGDACAAMNAGPPAPSPGCGCSSDPRANHISAASPAGSRDAATSGADRSVSSEAGHAGCRPRHSPCLARRECGSFKAQNAGACEGESLGGCARRARARMRGGGASRASRRRARGSRRA